MELWSGKAAYPIDPCSLSQYFSLIFCCGAEIFSLETRFPVGVAAEVGQGGDWRDKDWYQKSSGSICT